MKISTVASYITVLFELLMVMNKDKATICWNHVFHQKFPKMVCGQADYYHYPLYVLKDF